MSANSTKAAAAAALLALSLVGSAAGQSTDPAYTPSGNLMLPSGYETWVFVGSNLGLAYKDDLTAMTADEQARAENRVFHNIYIDPSSYATFIKTGEFPDPTVLVMELYLAEDKAPKDVLKEGVFNGRRVLVEAAVKDSHRPTHEGSTAIWAYYTFGVDAAEQPGREARAANDTQCFDCHKLHASHDHVWTQFYPLLRRRLAQ